MNNDMHNPLNDFLKSTAEPADTNLFKMPFPEGEIQQTNHENENVTAASFVDDAPKSETVTPSSEATVSTGHTDYDPYAAALQKAQVSSEQRLLEPLESKPPVFVYGKVKEEIQDKSLSFEQLRLQYEFDFMELSDPKKVTWTVSYGKINKVISNPTDKIFEVKSEIEHSPGFISNLKKAKSDADKNPVCEVKPRITAQTKGEASLPAYKEFCMSMEEARQSPRPIIMLPSKDGKIYELRKNEIGTFTAPATLLPEFPEVKQGFEMKLPKIPYHILLKIQKFFRTFSDGGYEALAHILYDTSRAKYLIRIPRQTVSRISVNAKCDEPYPDHLLHVMDIHSHNYMKAEFSPIDDKDETATRLYAVMGKLDCIYPELKVRASCNGKFIPIPPESVFDTNVTCADYPKEWEHRVEAKKQKRVVCLPATHIAGYLSGGNRL